MKEQFKQEIMFQMATTLNFQQLQLLEKILKQNLRKVEITSNQRQEATNDSLLNLFISSKKVEGCPEKSLVYYRNTIEKLFEKLGKKITGISTNDLRFIPIGISGN